MQKCSITTHLQIAPAGPGAYRQLARFHYRDEKLGPCAAIFALIDAHPVRKRLSEIVGVIVYSMPAPALELRNIATAGMFSGFSDRSMQLQLVNENIRCISRVIIEPRYRGLGLASRLVAETMPKPGVPIIEAMAVMGRVNPFFEKAGMKAYSAPVPARCTRLTEALSLVGIESETLPAPQTVQEELDSLEQEEKEFIAGEFRRFLQAYGKRRNMPGGLERTRYIISKLTLRPVYYIWLRQWMSEVEKNLPPSSLRTQREND